MLGSLPVSPTSLNWKIISKGETSSDAPVLSVTNIRGSSTAIGSGSTITSSSPKQPESEKLAINRARRTAFVRMTVPITRDIMTLRNNTPPKSIQTMSYPGFCMLLLQYFA